MSCCKTKDTLYERKEGVEISTSKKVFGYFFRIIGFIISLVLLPFIILGVVWFIFDKLVLNNDFNVADFTKNLASLDKYFRKNEVELDDDDDEEFSDDEVVMINVEDITKK